MLDTFLPFAKPSISEDAIDEVVACLRSGWITTGPRTAQFEQQLAEYCQAPHALCLNSATAGLHTALLSLELQPGDEVITTPLTFVATLNTIVQAGGTPVLADIDPNTLNISVEHVKKSITNRTRAIVPVHFAGLPVDLDPLYELAKTHQLHIVEDAAHAIGAHYKNKVIGSFGHTQVFSFHPNKNMTTGEGGCVVTRDDDMAHQISVLRFHGISRAAFDRFSKSGTQHYEVVTPGFKYNMLDIQAALGIHQLKRLDDFIAKRTALANRYLDAFKDKPYFQLPKAPNYAHRHAWHLFTPLVNTDYLTRDTFMSALKEKNIGSGLHYITPHLYPYYQQTFGFQRGTCPIAEDIGDRIVSLPLFPDLTIAQQDHVIETINSIFTS